jgi:hypothetical protein
VINVEINKTNKCIGKRNSRKISFRDIIYYSSILIGNNYSYANVNSHLKINHILNVSTMAIIKQKCALDYKYFENLNDAIIKFIYNDHEKRIIAVDGTNINLPKALKRI